MCEALRRLVGETVVLDTASPILYIGRLAEVTESVFVLTEADMHDCRDGHANREHYIAETRRDGVTVNRRGIVVLRPSVISVSRLEDVEVD